MNHILHGDVRQAATQLPDQSVHCIVTSPPYWGLRDYGHVNQIGLEPTPEEYVQTMVGIFRELRRVLRDDGTLWLNLGDSYASGNRGGNTGHSDGVGASKRAGANGQYDKQANRNLPAELGYKSKDLVGIPWRVALALQADGWYLRSDIIWSKPNPMPESVTDRPTKAHEYLFLLAKSERYYYDAEAIREEYKQPQNANGGILRGLANGNMPHIGQQQKHGRNWVVGVGRNRRTVWEIATQPYSGAHFAVFPPKLIEPCILAGCPVGGVVLDPFFGSGTTGAVAKSLGRNYIGIELNKKYIRLAERRIAAVTPPLPGIYGMPNKAVAADRLPPAQLGLFTPPADTE